MLPHTLITASAGSGKTWSLTVRYLRLLMMGAEPESIVALTFSRKAAGEFFNAILHRLAEAAAGTDAAARLAADIRRPGTTPEEFCQGLERLVSRLPQLMLGTLDSFFIRMARSFPFELGLNGDFTLLDEHQQLVEKQRVYERVFAPEPAAGSGTDAARREFMQAFAEATHGREEVSVRAKLDEFIRQWHALFLTAPDLRQWADPSVIWPPPAESPVPGPAVDRAAAVARIRSAMERAVLTDKQRERWAAFLDDALVHPSGGTFTRPLAFLFHKVLEQMPSLEAGSAVLTVERKKQIVDGPAAEALVMLCRDLLAREIQGALRQTRGIYEVIRRYDAAYHELVRRRGRLTFQDVQLILAGGLSPETSGARAREERALTHAENRQLMDYRLDARYHHWLLDEFQDTSRVQWQVLANLIDEAVQDSEGQKSFFAVGDQKQSIYEWRGGTPRLFDEIERQYNSGASSPGDQPVKIEPLSVSQRSGPAVIRMVNELLGNPEALAEVLPPASVAEWPWQEHTSRNLHYGGAAMVLEVPEDPADETAAASPASGGGPAGEGPPEDEDGPAEVNARWRRAADLLLEIQPLRRGLTCAVLCHRNPRALAIAGFLRSATGMEVVCESGLSIARDNPATSALLALFQAAAHPADQFAWQHVMMTPLRAIVEQEFPGRESRAAQRVRALHAPAMLKVLGQIAELGFHGTLRWWITALRHACPELDAFSQERLEELCVCAAEFDRSGSRDPDAFLVFADSWRVRGASHAGAIQVMTVHRSKGLTFDLVLIPDLEDRMFLHTQPVGIKQTEAGGIEWLLRLPPKALAEADPVLAGALHRAEAAQWRERLAGLYVMVTRARYANCIFLKPAPKTPGRTPSLARTVRHLLTRDGGGTFSLGGQQYPILSVFGDPGWYLDHGRKPVAPDSGHSGAPPAAAPVAVAVAVQQDLFAPPEPLPAAPRKVIPLRRRRPSETPETPPEGPAGGLLYQSARDAAREAGLAVHNVFRKIRWAEDIPSFLTSGEDSPFLPGEAGSEVAACLRDPRLLPLFSKPEGRAEVWRERAFDVVLDGVAVSGIFDRVTVRRAPDGTALSAVLVDFKTGPVTARAVESARIHREQMDLYRRALGRLLALPEEAIRTVLLFTATREAVELQGRIFRCIHS